MSLSVVIRHESVFIRVQEVNSNETVIGRDRSCGIWLPDVRVSRRHAILARLVDNFRLQDLQSSNGTRLNGCLIRGGETIQNGSRLEIGPFSLNVFCEHQDAINESMCVDCLTGTERSSLKMLAPEPQISLLTPSQRRVFNLLIRGMIEKEVAAELGITIHTVHDHAKAIYKILNVSTRGELISRWG